MDSAPSSASRLSISSLWNIHELYGSEPESSPTILNGLETENKLQECFALLAEKDAEIVELKRQLKLAQCDKDDQCPHAQEIKQMCLKIERLEKLIEKISEKPMVCQLGAGKTENAFAFEASPAAPKFMPHSKLTSRNWQPTTPFGCELTNRTPFQKPSTSVFNKSYDQSARLNSSFNKPPSANFNSVFDRSRKPSFHENKVDSEIEQYRRERIISTPNAETLMRIQNCYRAMRQ